MTSSNPGAWSQRARINEERVLGKAETWLFPPRALNLSCRQTRFVLLVFVPALSLLPLTPPGPRPGAELCLFGRN